MRLRPILAVSALAACGLAAPALAQAEPPPPAKDTMTSKILFTIKDDRVRESSGIETSNLHPKIVYTHNDSGDDARFFAIGRSGATRAVYTLDGAGSWDWEDMSGGPRDTLWFGDIGANQLGREDIAVYKVKEPKRVRSGTPRWTRYNFVYDDGSSHNAEALLVHPRTGAVFVVTKAESGAGVYRAAQPLSTSRDNVLKRIASAPTKVTSGDFSANGKRIVLRNYGTAFFLRKFGGPATEVRLPSGGESIAFARRGVGVIMSKEGLNSPVWRAVVRKG